MFDIDFNFSFLIKFRHNHPHHRPYFSLIWSSISSCMHVHSDSLEMILAWIFQLYSTHSLLNVIHQNSCQPIGSLTIPHLLNPFTFSLIWSVYSEFMGRHHATVHTDSYCTILMCPSSNFCQLGGVQKFLGHWPSYLEWWTNYRLKSHSCTDLYFLYRYQKTLAGIYGQVTWSWVILNMGSYNIHCIPVLKFLHEVCTCTRIWSIIHFLQKLDLYEEHEFRDILWIMLVYVW